MKWEKLGRILEPDPGIAWLEGYTGPACTGVFNNNRVEIYLSGRDALNRSRIGKIIFDLSALKVIEIVKTPVLELGERGTFDFNGTAYPWLLEVDGFKYLYYTGWNKGVHVDFINDVGLALANQQNTEFVKVSRATILPRMNKEPFGIGSVCVLLDDAVYKMWYTCFVKWGAGSSDKKHYYHIRYAESSDGINWKRPGVTCIDYDLHKNEYVTGKPCVLRFDDYYVMWYSFRGDTYKIGMAVSRDGVNWKRCDDFSGITASDTGWDSEMVCYACVFVHEETLYMLYNGNGYGKSGLGLARMNLSEFKRTVKNLADEGI